jgi:hypothetical protein
MLNTPYNQFKAMPYVFYGYGMGNWAGMGRKNYREG